MHPFSYRAKSTLCRVFLDPSPPHPCLGSPQPVLINVCVWGGTMALGAGHLANLALGNKKTEAVRPAPQKMPPTTFQMAPNIGAGIHPRPRPPPPGYTTPGSEAQTMQCRERASGARFSLKWLYPALFHCTPPMGKELGRI